MTFGQQPNDLLRDGDGFDREEVDRFLIGMGIQEIKKTSHGLSTIHSWKGLSASS